MSFKLRRLIVGCVAAVLVLAAGSAVQAQLLNKVRDDALIVVKVNNLQGLSQKIADLAQKLGVAQLLPPVADPLGAAKRLLKQELHLASPAADGLDEKGDAALVMFQPVAGEPAPRMMVLLPVSDFKAFLTNFPDAKSESKDSELHSFAAPNGEPLFLDHWDKYAAVTPWKDLLLEQPQGLKVAGPIARQFQDMDVTLYVNMKVVRELVLPGFQQIKQMVQNMPMPNAAEQPNAAAFQKAMAIELFDAVEAFLTQSHAVAQSFNLVPTGLASTFSAQFEPGSDLAKRTASLKNTDANLISGMPREKYLVFGGAAFSGQQLWDAFNGMYAPALKAPSLTEAETKSVNGFMDAYKQITSSATGMRFGLIQPPAGANLEQGLLHGFAISNGNAKEMLDGQRKMLGTYEAFMKATGQEGLGMKMQAVPGGKSIDGVAFDAYKLTMTPDPKLVPDPRAAMLIKYLYGSGLESDAGAVNDKTVVSLFGVDDATAKSIVSAARQDQSALAGAEGVKAATDNLPKSRVAVAYIAVDNIFTTAMDIASRLGGIRPVKLPPDLPPAAMSLATENDTVRIDGYLPTSLVQSMVSAVIQMQIQRAAPHPAPAPAQP